MKGLYYEQRSGTFGFQNGDHKCPIGTGSAGRAPHRNDPEKDHVRGMGPLPRGDYRMGVVSHPRFAAPAIRLSPVAGTDTKGRSGFYIHGGTHSEGCILIQRRERTAIAALIDAGFDTLRVER